MRTFRETDQLLSDHMPTVTRRLFWAVLISFFAFAFLSLSEIGRAIADRVGFLKASQAILQGHLWQFIAYPFAPSSSRALDSILNTAIQLVMIFFTGRLVEDPMGARRFTWFMVLCAVGTGLAHALFGLGTGAIDIALASFLPLNLAMLTVLVIWYPDATIRFLFFIPMPMKFFGGLAAALLLLLAMGTISQFGWPIGYALSLHLVVAPLIAWVLIRYPRILDVCEDLWWHNPFRKGPKPVKRMSMGHPGRHSDPDDRYNDPHWKLDQ